MSAKRVALGVVVGVSVLIGAVLAQSTPAVWTVESVGYFTSGGKNTARRVVLRAPLGTATPNPGLSYTLTPYVPPPVACTWHLADPVSVTGACTLQADGSYSQTVTTTRKAVIDAAAQNGGACLAKDEVTVTAQPCTPPAPVAQIWGMVDASTLGTCSAAVHDTYVVDGGDGWKYRTWHPQRDPSGCIFSHEHGDDPARMTNAEIAASPIRFGYIGRRMVSAAEPNGHEEAHEGFKVFIAVPGEVNDEGRVNRVFSRSVFHMGTGGPKRFGMRHHSAEIRLIHPEFNLKAFTQVMMDTGGVGIVCDPRTPGATKDVISLAFSTLCGGKKLGSLYEIWRTEGSIRFQGREVYHAFANPAVFDPITAFNPDNPTELVMIGGTTDPRVQALKQFPSDNWAGSRGCDRESYAQPGYWYNANGRTTYYTDAHGNELPATDPNALVQIISQHNSIAPPATLDGNPAYKSRPKRWCAPGLGLKN